MRRLTIVALIAGLLAVLLAAPAGAATARLASAGALYGLEDIEWNAGIGSSWSVADELGTFEVAVAKFKLDADGDLTAMLIGMGKDSEAPWYIRPGALVTGYAIRHLGFYYSKPTQTGIVERVYIGGGVTIGGGKSVAHLVALWQPERLGNVRPDRIALTKQLLN